MFLYHSGTLNTLVKEQSVAQQVTQGYCKCYWTEWTWHPISGL